ncbi:exported hypothetical protein [Paraburkholderia tropica]|nr:exported hypothetical protein [Paraburkholderia tropica]
MMIQTEAAGAACRSVAMAGSAVLAMAVSSVASATASMIAAMARRFFADMGSSARGVVSGGAVWVSDKAAVSGESEGVRARRGCSAIVTDVARLCSACFRA